MTSTLQELSSDVTSSLNKHHICDNCNKIVRYRSMLIRHLQGCLMKRCKWCSRKFKDQDLFTHMFYIHGDKLKKQAENENERLNSCSCKACGITFSRTTKLMYHIRQFHFNLKSKAPYCEKKKVNQIWFENVINSQNVVEIKKASTNCLVIRRLDNNTSIKVNDLPTDDIDVTTAYPITENHNLVECSFCNKELSKKKMKSHLKKYHQYFIKVNTCSFCFQSFPNTKQYLNHVCHGSSGSEVSNNAHKTSKFNTSQVGSISVM